MNKSELITAMAERAELSKKDTEKALKAFVDVISDELVKGEKIQIVGFGTFEVVERKEREGGRKKGKEKGRGGREVQRYSSSLQLCRRCSFQSCNPFSLLPIEAFPPLFHSLPVKPAQCGHH